MAKISMRDKAKVAKVAKKKAKQVAPKNATKKEIDVLTEINKIRLQSRCVLYASGET